MDLFSTFTTLVGTRVHTDEPLARHTNLRIGGPARYYVEARTTGEVMDAIRAAAEAGVPWAVLGGGSNTLAGDRGFPGLVIQMAMRAVTIAGNRVTAGAGAITAAVARQAGEAGLAGFEWAVSLPGTVGGAVRGNAGCFGGEMKDVVEDVNILDVQHAECKVQKVVVKDCNFRYRHSTFKEHPDRVILEVTLALQSGDPAACRARMDEFLERRKVKQPLERPSAGCLFTNVEFGTLSAEQIECLDRATHGAWRAVVHDSQIPTGWLIQQAGCGGMRVGGAMVSERHGNFVINVGGATAADIAALSAAIAERVRAAFGVTIREEVARLGA